MKSTSRKQFIKQVGLASLAVLMKQVASFAADVPYNIEAASNNNVVFYTKADAAYETLRKGFNKRINHYPKVIALCSNEQGVVEAMQYATTNQLKVTVKSGGHCMEGFSCLQDGMVINVSLLNTIEWVNGNVLKVGPACTLKNIYETIIPKGKYLPGGSCQSVAISGLALGGGYGLMSRQFGLTCDSLVNATIVLPSGSVMQTDKEPDLQWACKGGGNGNFGVITSMKFALQKAPATMQSIKFRNQNVSIEKAMDICKQWFTLSKTLPNSCFSAFIFNGKTTYILLTNTQPADATVNNFIKTFTALSTKVSIGKALPFGTALKAYYAAANPLTYKNASAGLYKSYEQVGNILEDVFKKVKSVPGFIYQVNTLGGNIQLPAFEASSAFAHRDCIYFSELQAYWENPKLNEKYLGNFENIQQLFAQNNIKAQYRNYPDINFNNAPELYYGKNVSRLKKVKQNYDPFNLFAAPQGLL